MEESQRGCDRGMGRGLDDRSQRAIGSGTGMEGGKEQRGTLVPRTHFESPRKL
jgi:hypothetical protein